MSLIIRTYKKNFLIRYDFDPAIPYYSVSDFNGLNVKEETFLNVNNKKIHYFIYQANKFNKHKIVLFLPGIGPGHKAYLKQINEIAKAGFKVLTLDYEGCGYSEGERLPSIYNPTKDVISLLSYLHIDEEVIIVGHSLGAFTALNVINRINSIRKAVIISGFTTVRNGMISFTKSKYIANKIARFEHRHNKEFPLLDNEAYLKDTTDHLLFIHSKDDPKCSYKYNIQEVLKFNNTNIYFYIEKDKKHNPTYTVDAVNYKDQIIDTYFNKLMNNEFKSIEERKAYFKDVSLEKLTALDRKVIIKIINFIED